MQPLKIEANQFMDRKTRPRDFSGVPLHVHDTHELCYLVSGSTKYLVGNELYLLLEGEMLFAPKNTLHQAEYNNTQETERIVFSFDDAFVGDLFLDYIHEMTVNKHIAFDNSALLKINRLIEQIEQELQNKKPGFEKMQRLYFAQLLVMISRYKKKPARLSFSSPMLLVKKIMDYIQSNYNTDITLTSLAKQFSISPAYLSKIFKVATNLGVKEFVTLSRIEAAEHFLRNPNLSITEIATKCGFNDSNYFAAVFKKTVGITPKRYATLIKNE